MKPSDHFDPTVFVIFGGTGDLTSRKLVPALYDLIRDRSMPAQFAVIAVGRSALSDAKLRSRLHDGVKKFSRHGKTPPDQWGEFAEHISYEQGDPTKPQTYASLGRKCASLDKEWGTKARRIFYMATPPSMFGEIPKHLGEAGLARDRERARIVVEKPIGYDLESALSLNATLGANFEESQIFRIDHYLGKETVQNVLAFRFANPCGRLESGRCLEDPTALQCLAGTAPLSYQSGKIHKVYLRRHCNKLLRQAVHLWANLSRQSSPWAAVYYEQLRIRGKNHACALRSLCQRWLKILWKMWQTGTRYDAELHARNRLKHGSWVLKIEHDQRTTAMSITPTKKPVETQRTSTAANPCP